MSNFKVEFTLKQHTPIIHFQSEQHGATLRATELKPKLDTFLKKYAFNDKSQEYKEYLIKDKEAFDYKISIDQDISKDMNIDKKVSMFFGNMGDGKDKKYKHNSKNLKIIIFSYKPELLKVIEQYFEIFLSITNFGTRQSKGYGSFYLDNRKFDKNIIPYKVYSFSTNDWEKDIKLLYSFLRQGINLPNRDGTRFYCKPAIFSYAKSKGWTWDKKAIKREYFSDKIANQKGDAVEYQSDTSYLLRDLFGLSSEQSWMSYRTTISKENSDIDRFKSPMTFKIVDNIVYFWVNETIEEILNKEFKIQSSKRGNLKLKTPKEFDFNEFLDYSFNINLSQHIQSEYHSQSEYAVLSKIFKEIKVN